MAFALRMSLLWWIHRDRDAHVSLFFPTSYETWNVAHALALGNSFANPLVGMHAPTAWLAPGYPALVAVALKAFHMDDFAATIFALAINCMMSALTCIPIYALGKRLANHQVGLASCWLWVFLPTAILFPLEWLWDQSFSAFFVALLVYLTLELAASTGLLSWIGYGVIWSAAVLMNPAVGILFPFLLIWLIRQRKRNLLPWMQQVSVSAILLVLCLLPWTVRNYVVLGKLIPIKDNFGLEFWLGNNASVARNWRTDKHPVGDPQEMAQLLDLGEIKYMQLKQREAIEFVGSHPGIFLKLCLDRIEDTWTGMADVPSDRWVSALHAGVQYIWITTAFSLLAFAGILFGWRNLGPDLIPLMLTLIVFPATYYVTHSTLRYRHPIDSIMTVAAAYALVEIYSFASTKWNAHQSAKEIHTSESPLVD